MPTFDFFINPYNFSGNYSKNLEIIWYICFKFKNEEHLIIKQCTNIIKNNNPESINIFQERFTRKEQFSFISKLRNILLTAWTNYILNVLVSLIFFGSNSQAPSNSYYFLNKTHGRFNIASESILSNIGIPVWCLRTHRVVYYVLNRLLVRHCTLPIWRQHSCNYGT